MGIDVGDQAPAFELPGTGGRTYRLADYVGDGSPGAILAFYPGDETPVCTRQLCSYRDERERLDGIGVPMLGISPQGIDSHESFVGRHRLTIPLLADEGGWVGQAYGVVGGPLRLYRRAMFIVDGAGIVRWRDVSAVAGLGYRSVDEIERAVRSLPA